MRKNTQPNRSSSPRKRKLLKKHARVSRPGASGALAFVEDLFQQGEPVVLGVSGGADSMVLLELMVRLAARRALKLFVVHVNYGLRGEDSYRDETLVRNRCKELGVFLTIHRADELSPQDANLEERAREIRQRVLRETAREVGASAIALGHTRDDQAETMLLNVLRGSGLRGLRGMRMREGMLVRPLLNCGRVEVRQFAAAQGISYHEDASNLDQRFTRNRVRHLLIPLLQEQFNPSITTTLARTAELLADDEQFLDDMVAVLYRRMVKERRSKGTRAASIAARELLELPVALQRRLVRAMARSCAPRQKPLGHTTALELALRSLRSSNRGVEFPLGEALTLRRSRGIVSVTLQ